MLAPLLYMLALGGIGAAVMFSGYSQVLRSNAEMTAINTVRQQLNSAGQTLSASAALDSATSTIVQPPNVQLFSAVTDTARLPGNYAAVNASGAPHGYGVVDVNTGVRQLDPWGKYYVYCRWENPVSNASAPSIMVISGGPDGLLSTKCGDTAAQGDDRLNKLTVAEAINRANVWQVNSASQVKFGIQSDAVKVNDDGSMQAASLTLTTPLAITSGGTGAIDAVGARTNLSVPSNTGSGASGLWSIDISGNAATTTALQTARNFSIAGATGLTAAATSFDGTGDVALALTGTLSIANGGTNATTAAGARTSLAVLGIANNLSELTSTAATARANIAVLGIANNLSDVANVATARTNLGLGTMAVQDADNVNITGGTITGVTFTGDINGNASSSSSVPASGITGVVSIAQGGTGQTTANAALAALGGNNASNLTTGTLNAALLPVISPTSAGMYNWGTVDAYGRVTVANNLSTNSISQGNSGVSVSDTGTDGAVTISTEGLARITVDQNGNVGIGTATPADKLDVNGNIRVRGAAATDRSLFFSTLGSKRWALSENNVAESGSNLGSNFVITRYDDAGASLGNVFAIARNTGAISTSGDLTIGGAATATGGFFGTFNGTFAGTVAAAGADKQVQFNSGGNLSADSNFNWDNTNKAVGIGTTTPSTKAVLDLTSTTKGFLAPRMTTVQRDAIASPVTGLQVYNTTTNALNIYNGTSWGGVGGGTLASLSDATITSPANSDVLQYSSGTSKWVNTPLVSAVAGAAGPSFLVHKNGAAQSVAGSTNTKITWSTETSDTNNNFASDRFTPTVAGKYLIQAHITTNEAIASGTVVLARIYKNGAAVASGQIGGSAHSASGDVTAIIDMNGSTDYVEVYFYDTNASPAIYGPAEYTYFTGGLLAPLASGTVAGTGSAGYVPVWTSGNAVTYDSTAGGQFAWDLTNHSLGIGTATPSTKAVLDLTSTTKGFLPPRMTTVQRDAISTPVAGLQIYNTTTNAVNVYNGSAWGALGGIGSIATDTDVTLTSLANGNLLQYNSGTSKWVNVSAGSVLSGTSGTTTMASGWPDAIRCVGASGATNLALGWSNAAGTTANYTLMGDYGGTVSTNSPYLYFSSPTAAGVLTESASWVGWLTNCSSKTIAELYATGQAFNFIGTSLASAAAPSGGIQFNNGSGVLAGDSALIWDNTNKALGIGTATPSTKAVLDLTSTTKGFLPPRMTTAQRDAIASPVAGLEIYNTITNQPNVYNGTAWGAVAGSGSIATDTDVTLTSVANNDILRYDSTSSKWKNVSLGSALSGSSGTTTMVANWPDGILCGNFGGNPSSSRTYIYKGSTGTEWFYSMPGETGYWLQFNGVGSYLSRGAGSDNCTSQTITQLYAAGQAFNFIGSSLASAAAPSGGVQFNNGAGALAGDTALVWDNTNKALGIGTATPSSKAVLDLTSTTKGFLPPRMTTVQRDAITSPAIGLQVYNTTTNALNVFNGTAWGAVGGGGALSALTDVALTSTANNDILRYDSTASKWKNVSLGSALSGSSGTTTMVANWPDAIRCHGGNGSAILYRKYDSTSTGSANYAVGWSATNSGDSDLLINFNGAGAIILAQDRAPGTWTGWYETSCSAGQTVTGLYAAGRAFNFIGSSLASAAAPAGGIQFNNGSGVLAGDSAIIWDNTNKRLGIGTATPARLLDIDAGATADTGYELSHSSGTTSSKWTVTAPGTNNDVLFGAVSNNGLNLITNNTTRMSILNSGNVGIGTATPGSALDVKGTLRLSGATSGYVGFAPAAVAGSITYTLPNADGTSGQILSTNGAGVLSWATASGSGGGVAGYQIVQVDQVAGAAVGWYWSVCPGSKVVVGGSCTTGSGADVTNTSISGQSFGCYKQNTATNYQIKAVCADSSTGQWVTAGNDMYNANTAGVGIGTATPSTKAVLDLTSTTKGFLAPRMTTAQRDAISSPVAGLQIYNSTTNALNIHNGTTWGAVAGGGSIATDSDVTLTSVANNDILRYESATSKWKNVNIGTAMSTTTAYPNYPDAIRCSYGAAAGQTVMLYSYVPGSAYKSPYGTNYMVYYNSDGTYGSDATGEMYNGGAANCVGRSITQLYAAGQAFNFIGSSLASAAAPSGGLQFNNGSGVLAGDSAIIWDNTNKHLGIGTATPSRQLAIDGGSADIATGKAAIAITNSSTAYGPQLRLNSTGASGREFVLSSTQTSDASGASKFQIYDNTAVAARFVLDSSGNVGIGTTTPASKLHINMGSIQLDGNNAGTGVIVFKHTDTTYYAGGHQMEIYPFGGTTGGLHFFDRTSGGTPLWLGYNGNVGIGTTAPTQLLHVNGTAYATTFLHTSDRRLKTEIQSIPAAAQLTTKLRGVHFKWKKDGVPAYGVIAQEVEAVIPDAVTTNADGTKAVDYDQLIPVLIEAVKALQVEVDALKRERTQR